jgi:hypothetical protein
MCVCGGLRAEKAYEMPGGELIMVGQAQVAAPEIVFQPQLYGTFYIAIHFIPGIPPRTRVSGFSRTRVLLRR